MILSIGLPLISIYLGALAINFNNSKKVAYQNVESYLQQLVFNHAEKVNGEFVSFAQVAETTADFISISPDVTEEDLYEIAENNTNQNPRIYGSCIAFEPYSFNPAVRIFAPYVWRGMPHEDGAALKKMDVARDAYDYLGWAWYKDPKEKNASLWTEPYFDEGAGNVVMVTYSAPFYRDGKFRGIATVDVYLEKLQEWGNFGPDFAAFAILTREGKFLSHSDPKYIMNRTIFSLAEENKRPDIMRFGREVLLKGQGVSRIKNFPAGENSFVVYAPVRSTGWVFMAAVPESKIMAPVWRQLLDLGVFMLACLIMIVLALFIVSFKITKPIRKLSSDLRQVASGNLDIRHNGKYPQDEIGELMRTFHWMAGELKSYIGALTAETEARSSLESELRIAREIQSSLLPGKFPPFPEHTDFDLHALNVPARHVAGDFFDYFFISDTELFLVIGDVCGKGIAAAMFMAITRTHLRNFAEVLKEPSRILSQVNKELARDNEKGFFVSIALVHYNIKTGQVSYSIAGHPPPYIISVDGNVRAFGEVGGTVLGILEDESFQSGSGRLERGEELVFYTDGVTEARNTKADFWASDRFEGLMKENRALSVRDLCEAVYNRVAAFQEQKLADDFTIMALKRN